MAHAKNGTDAALAKGKVFNKRIAKKKSNAALAKQGTLGQTGGLLEKARGG